MNQHYVGIDEEEYGAYWILDISNCEKTKEYFLDKDEEIYDIYAWEDYIHKCGKPLKRKEVVELLNNIERELYPLLRQRTVEIDDLTEKYLKLVKDIGGCHKCKNITNYNDGYGINWHCPVHDEWKCEDDDWTGCVHFVYDG